MAGDAGKTKAKSFSMEHAFVEELTAARRSFVESESEMVWNLLNGSLAEGVFLQMVARVGMEAIAASEETRQQMWKHIPSTARGYRP